MNYGANIRQATVPEIRAWFHDMGHTVRIGRDGHITFRKGGEGPRLEGRHVSEYRYAPAGKIVSDTQLIWC